MSRNIGHLIRLSVTSAALTGFIVASASILTPQFGFATAAQAENGIRATKDLCFWEHLGWDELQPSEQKAWAKLGWTEQMWEDEASTAIPESEYKDWDELTPVEQQALLDLGYSAQTWETFDSDAC